MNTKKSKRKTKKQKTADRLVYCNLLANLYQQRHESYLAIEYLTMSQPKETLIAIQNARISSVKAEAVLRDVAERYGWKL